MPENVLQFTTRVDLSGAKTGVAELAGVFQDGMDAAQAAVESASAGITSSLDEQASAAKTSTDQISAAYQKMEAQGIETLSSLNAAVAESTSASVDAAAATSDAVSGQATSVAASVDIQAAAYRQLATATLEAATARRQMADAQGAFLAGELPAADAETLLAEAMERSSVATEQLALAKGNLAEVTEYLAQTSKAEAQAEVVDAGAKMENAEASEAAAAAEETEGTAIRSTMSARMAASAEMRVLEGNIQGSTRAAGAFLTMIPGMGEALQAAFTVFGAVALLEVIYQIGDALYKAFDVGGQRAQALQAEIDQVNHAFEQTNIEIEIQTQKLEQETAKLEKKPFNGLQLALLESQDATDKLVDKLKGVEGEELKALKLMEGSGLQQFFGITVSTNDEQTMLAQHQHWLEQAKDTQQVINEDLSYGVALQQKMVDLKRSEADAATSVVAAEYQKDIANTQQQIDKQQEELAIARNEQTKDAATKEHQHAVDVHTGESAADKAARAKLKAIETEFADLNRAKQQVDGVELDPAAAGRFWNGYIDAFKRGTDEYRKVLDETIKYSQSAHKQLFDEILKSSPDQAIHLAHGPEERQRAIDAATRAYEQDAREQKEVAKASEEMNKELQKQAENLTHTGDRWDGFNKSLLKADEITAQNAANISAATDKWRLATDAIDQLGADQDEAARSTALYRAQLAALNDELTRLQSASKLVDTPLGKRNTDPTNAAQIQQIKNEIAQLTGSHQVNLSEQAQKEAQDIAKPYLDAFNHIDTAWRKVQNDLIAGNKNIRQNFIQME